MTLVTRFSIGATFARPRMSLRYLPRVSCDTYHASAMSLRHRGHRLIPQGRRGVAFPAPGWSPDEGPAVMLIDPLDCEPVQKSEVPKSRPSHNEYNANIHRE